MRKGAWKCESCRHWAKTHSYSFCDLTDGCISFKGKCPLFRRIKVIKYPI
jgi:hypothetical protein